MARFKVPDKNYIRADDSRYLNAFQAIEDAINNHSDQGNLDPSNSQLAPPPAVAGISVVESGGIHDVKIDDQSPAYRGIQYSAFYSQTPDFQNVHRIDLGESQNHRINLGPGKYYWAAASKYSASDHSPMTFHGGTQPIAVGSGAYSGPPMQQGQGFSGQYRSSTTPPIRK